MTAQEAIAKIRAEIERLKKKENDLIENSTKKYGAYPASSDIMLIAYQNVLRYIARHFAQWGAEHLANSNGEVVINGHELVYDKGKDALTMKPIPNDLEEAAALEGWVAVDSDTEGHRRVIFFSKRPVRDVLTRYKYWAATRPRFESIQLDSNAFPNLKWEDEPKKVKLIIRED